MFVVMVLLPQLSLGQYTVNNAVNAVDGVPNILLGGGVTYSGLVFSGNNSQIGGFTCNGNCNLGISSGLVIGTGNVNGSDGPNNSAGFSLGPPAGIDNTTDPDLDLLTASDLNNVARLEFDFVPTGDSITFNFAFGSEEYPEYSNDPLFNDVFGFFLSGPGIVGPFQNAAVNIAVLPNGLPITINNVNPFNNAQYYNTNNGNAIQADGFTDVLTAFANVECGETYHIKIVIADAFDDLWDSWVFLEANSFESNQLALNYVTPVIPSSGGGILEGCSSAELNFSRTGNLNQSYTIQHDLSGSATLGSDYVLNPSSWTFQPGQTDLSIEINALADGIVEGNEQIILTYLANGCVGSDVVQMIEISELLPLSVSNFDVVIPCNEQAVLTPMPSGGTGLYEYSWPDGSHLNSLTVLDPFDNQVVDLIISDTCGVESITVSAAITFIQQDDLALDVVNFGAPFCGEIISLSATGSGGLPPYSFSWFTDSNLLSSSSSLNLQLVSDSSISVTLTDQCDAQISFDTIVAPQVEILGVNLGNDIIGDCLTEILLSSVVTPNYGGLLYQWNYDGDMESSAPTLEITTGISMSVTLNVSDQCGNAGNDIIEIIIPDPEIVVDAGGDIEGNCLGNYMFTATVNGSVGNVNYQWLQNDLVVANEQNYDVPTSVSSEYVVVASDECGGMSADTVLFVLSEDAVNIDIVTDTTVSCITNLLLAPIVSGGVGQYTFEWTNESGVVLSNNSSYSSLYSSAVSNITVEVTDECGHSSSSAITVNIPPVPVSVQLPEDTATNCITSLNLMPVISGGIGVYSFEWVDESGNILSQNLGYESLYAEDQMVTFSVSDECGNSSTETTMVNLINSTISVMLPSDTSTDCLTLMELQPIVSGGIGNYSFIWSNSLGSVMSNAELYSGYFAQSENIELEVTDECGGSASHSIAISIPDIPISIGLTNDTVGDCITPMELIPQVSGGVGVYSFEWMDVLGNTLSFDSVFIEVLSASQIVTFSVVDECGNLASQSVSVQLPEEPVGIALVSDTTTNCISAMNLLPIVSGGIGSYSYSWQNSNGFILGDEAVLSALFNSDTSVTLEVNDECGNSAEASTHIHVPPVTVNLTAISDTSTDCITPLTLDVVASGGVGLYTFQWLNSSTGAINDGQSYTDIYTASTLVEIIVLDECSNEATTEILVDVPPVPIEISDISDIITTCIDPVEITPQVSGGVGNYLYQWTVGGSLISNDNVLNEIVEASSFVTLVASDLCGNSSEELFFVSVPPVPVNVELGENIVTDCISSNSLIPFVSGGIGGYEYSWSDNAGYVGNTPAIDYVAASNASIQLIVTDQCGNSAADVMSILVPAVPVYVSCFDDTTVCRGDMIYLNADAAGGVGQLNYVWTGFETLGNTPPIFPENDSNVFEVIVMDQCGNSASDSYKVFVTSVEPLFDVITEDNIDYVFLNVSDDADEVNWSFSTGESFGNLHEVSYFNSSADVWSVTLTAIRENGCRRSITREFRPASVIYVPNTFTPDGDGINDVFMPVGIDISNYSCKIFNRFGELIYQTNDLSIAWAGGAKDSEYYVQSGLYYYVIDAMDGKGEVYHLEGNVLIAR